MSEAACWTCKARPALFKGGGECARCYMYRRRNGRARPPIVDRLPRSDRGKERPHLWKRWENQEAEA